MRSLFVSIMLCLALGCNQKKADNYFENLNLLKNINDVNSDGVVDYMDAVLYNKSTTKDNVLARLEETNNIPEEVRRPKKIVTESHFIDKQGLVDWNDWQSDPSRIIHHDGEYHMWFIRFWECKKFHDPNRKLSSTAHAVSKDGVTWEIVGTFPIVGKPGDFDDFDISVPEVIVVDGKFYAFYTGWTTQPKKWGGIGRAAYRKGDTRRVGTGLCVADSPYGPWKRIGDKPVLARSDDPNAWDYNLVENPRCIPLNGKWVLYYKGQNRDRYKPTLNGIAIADNIEGPYKKYKYPIIIGHGHWFLKYKHGILYFPASGNDMLWSEDGVHFAKVYSGKASIVFGSLFLPEDPLSNQSLPASSTNKWWGFESVNVNGKRNWDIQRIEWELGAK